MSWAKLQMLSVVTGLRGRSRPKKIKLNPPNVFLADAHDWERVNRELATVVLSVEDNPFILHFNTTD